ncbi:enteropeptidase [Labeo rohita]|uniref:Enteropeptidase n=1 Tax=Labeo rohita TaxID=84645 RepID=A0A498N9W7_LABRO|nr:enteropeptidase [Labeo rohita]
MHLLSQVNVEEQFQNGISQCGTRRSSAVAQSPYHGSIICSNGESLPAAHACINAIWMKGRRVYSRRLDVCPPAVWFCPPLQQWMGSGFPSGTSCLHENAFVHRRAKRLSSTEVLLITLLVLLFVACVGLSVVTWLALDNKAADDGGDQSGSEFTGRLVISNGTVFTEELLNTNSAQFKALAYDTEQKINDAYSRSSLKEQFRSSKVNEFSEGSVVVFFDVFLLGVVDSQTVQEQLVSGLQQAGDADDGLVIDIDSVRVSVVRLLSVTAVNCPEGQKACADGSACIPQSDFCDGVQNCADGTDEDHTVCATACDGQFLLLGPTGSFHSKNFPEVYDSPTSCRWIVRVTEGSAIKIVFHTFQTEQDIDILELYEGTGPTKTLTYSLSGKSPGDIWLLSHEATVEFFADYSGSLQGFNATYSAENVKDLSRYYITTPRAPGSLDKKFRISSLPLTPAKESVCLQFWYHMFGEEVWRLMVTIQEGSSVIVLFQKEGNYGNNWNYGQATLNITADAVVVFEAQKKAGFLNDIALDDVSIVSGSCGPAPPEPTPVPPPTTPPPIPGVLTGDRSFPDLFSTSSQMTVMLFTDASSNDRGFLANFSTGVNLGQPDPCPSGQFQCGTGACLSNSSVCDGTEHCPDGSDEADCVHIIKDDVTGTQRLRLQVQSHVYTACAQDWSAQFSDFFCRYLGYRSGNASFSSVMDGDAPFTTVSVNANGSLELNPSDACLGEKIVSLHCNNQPCGARKVPLKRESNAETDGNKAGRVVGGQDAQKGAWPWIASLRWLGRHACGAALIDREWLITAAHCVYGKNVHLSNWAVVLGLHSQYETDNTNKQVHSIDQVIMHKRYNRRTKESDFALMHLQTPANYTDYVQPICLPDAGAPIEEGRKCFIAGWGLTAEDGTTADVLQEAVVPLLSNKQCQEWLPEYNFTERMLCAGYAEGGVDTCKGDSGGPLMCEEAGGWVLVGVTSFGVGCGRPQRPGAYARVSQFIEWVSEKRRLYSDWTGV